VIGGSGSALAVVVSGGTVAVSDGAEAGGRTGAALPGAAGAELFEKRASARFSEVVQAGSPAIEISAAEQTMLLHVRRARTT
jgi:hypothetical protein